MLIFCKYEERGEAELNGRGSPFRAIAWWAAQSKRKEKMDIMDIKQSTCEYEKWLREQLQDLPGFNDSEFAGELQSKHEEMQKKHGEHAFLRGTFYRWAQRWVAAAATEGAPVVIPVVGDTHVENFGTWRDVEGRLVWGVNDFDEACELPWTSDLVRLGVSASLALEILKKFKLSANEVCDAIHKGYAETFKKTNPAPLVLQERHQTLLGFANKLILKDSPRKWWQDQEQKKLRQQAVPSDAQRALESALLPGASGVKTCVRKGKPAGMGSRGKPRYYALGIWRGAKILREAKAIVPSALQWALGGGRSPGRGLQEMLVLSVRCPDPHQAISGRWIVRRLAPDSEKIELGKLGGASADEQRELFEDMGAELANLHLGTAALPGVNKEDALRLEVNQWTKSQFREQVKHWRKTVLKDFKDFKAS